MALGRIAKARVRPLFQGTDSINYSYLPYKRKLLDYCKSKLQAMLTDGDLGSITEKTNGHFPCAKFCQRKICLEKEVLELSLSPAKIKWNSH